MLGRLAALTHSDGSPMTRIYGPLDTADRGGTVAFNFLDRQGRVVDERLVEREAAASMVSLRTGCFCNPGAGELAFGIGGTLLGGRVSKAVHSIDEYLQALRLPSGGAVRASLGLVSNTADVEQFITFAESTYRDRLVRADGLPPRERC
jgi:selenocysteine lyase/cysteine desulfurase